MNNAIAVEGVRGFRLDKTKTTRKIDAAVALSMAHWGAAKEGHKPDRRMKTGNVDWWGEQQPERKERLPGRPLEEVEAMIEEYEKQVA